MLGFGLISGLAHSAQLRVGDVQLDEMEVNVAEIEEEYRGILEAFRVSQSAQARRRPARRRRGFGFSSVEEDVLELPFRGRRR